MNLNNQPPVETTDQTDELRKAAREMTRMLEEREWAEHVSNDPDATALESEITNLVGLYNDLRAKVQPVEAAGAVQTAQPMIGRLLDEFSELPVLWGLNEPGALVRHSDVFKMLVAAGKAQAATHPAEPDNEEGGPTDQLVSMLHSQRSRLLDENAKLRAALSGVPAVGGALVARYEQVETGMADRLRRIVTNIGEGPIAVQSKLLLQAADECDRFYNGMMNWKATAQAKDRTIIELREPAPTESAAAPAGSDTERLNLIEQIVNDEGCFYFHNNKPRFDLIGLHICGSLRTALDAMQERVGATHQPAPAPADLNAAARDVLAERRRQVEQEGWTPEHDDEHSRGELSYAACSYAVESGHLQSGMLPDASREPPFAWPWDKKWWKSGPVRRNLVKAGALILADIERLDRTTHQPIPTKGNGDTDKGEGA